MTKRFAGVALAAVMTCALAGSAQAYEYIARGTVTSFTHDGGETSPNIVGRTFTLLVYGNSYYASYGLTKTDLGLTDYAFFYSNISGSVNDNNAPPGLSYINNNGSSSSIALGAFSDGSYLGGFVGDDAGVGFLAYSTTANIPLNPEQSFRAISVSGQGAFVGSPFYDADGNAEAGYSLTFNVTSLANIGAISEVPLPASAPLFGAALLGFGVLGYGMRRRGRVPSA